MVTTQMTSKELQTLMANEAFRLKSRELLQRSGKTLYRVSADGNVNYSTIFRWIDTPDKVKQIQGDVLLGFLRGLGYSDEEIRLLTLGELFEFEGVAAE